MSSGEPTTPPGRDATEVADAPPASSAPSGPSAWPAQAADLVVDIVDTIRDKTTTPVLTVARAIVYGVAIVFLAITSVVLLIVGLVRLIDNFLPGKVWATYLLLGSVFFILGLVLWATRRPKDAT